jgi:pimeloyl-ACP methyl ester carboxylesterase
MKKKPHPRSAFNLFLLISALLLFTLSCQQDEVLSDRSFDDEHQNLLKSTMIGPGRYTGTYKGGEWLISLPDPLIWNNPALTDPRVMVFYAHGMVDPVPFESVRLPSDSIGGYAIEKIVTDMLYMGYATTSYRDNGLVVQDAISSIQQLVVVVNDFFKNNTDYMPPDLLLLAGPSEGGMVTVMTIEKYPQLFDGAISICGPIGSFYDQLQYNGDFHVLFNYFFGNELAAYGIANFETPIDLGNPQDGVDPLIMSAWKNSVPFNLQGIIVGLMTAYPEKVVQLLNCANVPVDMKNPVAMGTAVLELLRFNIMLTNDVIERMKGVPYNNMGKWYEGSYDDELLNETVQRIMDPSFQRARNFVRQYETSGRIHVPLVTIHTTGDHVTPFFHQEGYGSKIFNLSSDLLYQIDVVNYGHCTIDVSHIEEALLFIGSKIGGPGITAMDK